MTDLTQAIAEVKQIDLSLTDHKWTGLSIQQIDIDDEAESIATILNAVASGDMIPLADHKLAVAEAYRRAAEAIEAIPRRKEPKGGQTTYYVDLAEATLAILALADTDALAEVQALRADRDKWFGLALDNRHRAEAAEAELAATRAKLARVMEALSLAANRLLRCSVDYDAGTKKFIEVAEWAKEARAELTTLEGAKP